MHRIFLMWKLKKTKSVTYADPGMLQGLVGSDPFGRVNR